jgi:hypothetical protein
LVRAGLGDAGGSSTPAAFRLGFAPLDAARATAVAGQDTNSEAHKTTATLVANPGDRHRDRRPGPVMLGPR